VGSDGLASAIGTVACTAADVGMCGLVVAIAIQILHRGKLMSSPQDTNAKIQAMQEAANAFYRDAVRIGNHPFIEFAGLMNEYISACSEADRLGIDFANCNTHTGQHLPLHAHQVDYINEKLQCIFTGRSVLSTAAS